MSFDMVVMFIYTMVNYAPPQLPNIPEISRISLAECAAVVSWYASVTALHSFSTMRLHLRHADFSQVLDLG